jgi:hypothetical protein
MPVYRQTFFFFPPSRGNSVPLEVRPDLLPRFEPSLQAGFDTLGFVLIFVFA